MARILIPLAQGCEELEAVTLIDLLRRARFEVVTAALHEGVVTGSRGTRLLADTALDNVLDDDFDMIVLPGGLPGANHLRDDPRIHTLLHRLHAQHKFIAAICAAPKVLAKAGLLDGRTVTSFPDALKETPVPGLRYSEEPVVVDGQFVTSRGPGTAMDFALTLIELLAGRAQREAVEGPLQRPRHR